MSRRPPDPDSLLYAQYWEPVLATPARRALDRLEASPAVILDIGAGTGSLVLAAAECWPEARIVGLDASAGMLSVARHRVAVGRPEVEQQRFEWFAADAAAIPLGDASVDAVTSSFMLQLVDDRPAVLREVLRVLRPGGAFSMVTWLAEELLMPADDAFEEAVAALRLDGPDPGFRPPRITDYTTVDEARDELSGAGFDAVDARHDELRFAWTPAEYLKFKQCYDDRDLFVSLSADDRERLVEAIGSRWAALPEGAFAIRGPLVAATARKPLQ